MASASTSINCATCESNPDIKKIKIGILPCIGCRKQFCSTHMMEHRTYLAQRLETAVVNQRNELSEKIAVYNERGHMASISEQLNTISKWESDSIELIKQSAALARKQLEDMAIQHVNRIKDAFTVLSDQLHQIMEDESFFENDIVQLEQEVKQLQHSIERCPAKVQLNSLPSKLINVSFASAAPKDSAASTAPKDSVASASSVPNDRNASKCFFVDSLMAKAQPKKSIDLSLMKPGKILTSGRGVISFILNNQMSALDISTNAWSSGAWIPKSDNLYWCEYLNVFLRLEYSKSKNIPHKLFQIDLQSSTCEEILANHAEWNRDAYNNIELITSFRNSIMIVMTNKIERWPANRKDWHTDSGNVTCWYPPIAWRCDTRIVQICINDTNYAFLVKTSRSFEFEIRNHGMSILRYVTLNSFILCERMRFLSLPKQSGWLLFTKNANQSWCSVIDNDGKEHKQNILLSSNVDDIILHGNNIVIRKVNSDLNTDVIDLYDWNL